MCGVGCVNHKLKRELALITFMHFWKNKKCPIDNLSGGDMYFLILELIITKLVL